MQNNLETVGNAQVSTSVKKYGTGSLYFDGTSSNAIKTIQSTGIFDANKAFTIECWVYPLSINSGSTTFGIAQLYGGSQSWSTTNGIVYQLFYYGATLYWQWNNGGGNYEISTTSGISANTWQHITVSFDGTTTRLFVNGSVVASSTNSYSLPTTRNIFQVGQLGTTNGFSGYIDDLRVTSGLARYTANFTPPASALPTF
jgi:hypothetical protein